jgi:hypothetical protein
LLQGSLRGGDADRCTKILRINALSKVSGALAQAFLRANIQPQFGNPRRTLQNLRLIHVNAAAGSAPIFQPK